MAVKYSDESFYVYGDRAGIDTNANPTAKSSIVRNSTCGNGTDNPGDSGIHKERELGAKR